MAATCVEGIDLNFHRAIELVLLLGLVPLFSGCRRGTRVDRLPLHGTVTVADNEKLNGSITFLPAGGRPGPAATTGLSEGVYKFDRSNGPTAGSQTVILQRISAGSRVPQMHAAKKRITSTKSQWTQTIEVVDDGKYVHDFALKN